MGSNESLNYSERAEFDTVSLAVSGSKLIIFFQISVTSDNTNCIVTIQICHMSFLYATNGIVENINHKKYIFNIEPFRVGYHMCHV